MDALPGADAFATPLGTIAIDASGVAALGGLPQVVVSPAAHALEHSLEVHLPFLQEVLDQFNLLPLAVGDATASQVAEVLERLWGGDETLIVVSSDLSHYLPYETARREDQSTVRDMLACRADIDHMHACGATPVNGLLLVAQRKGLVPKLLDLRNSGDTAGDKVVAKMKEMKTDDPLFGQGTIRVDGRKMHPMHLFEVKAPAESKEPWDYYKLVSTLPAEQAFRPLDKGGCPLVKAN